MRKDEDGLTEIEHAGLDHVPQQLLVKVRIVKALVVDLLVSRRLGPPIGHLVLRPLLERRQRNVPLRLGSNSDRFPFPSADFGPPHEPFPLARRAKGVINLGHRVLVHGFEFLVALAASSSRESGRGEDLVGPFGDRRAEERIKAAVRDIGSGRSRGGPLGNGM